MNFPKIGMRNIKTSLSVFICLLLFESINRENSIYACVAAVICMQNTIVDSLEKGVSRIMGTIVGGIVGAVVLFFAKELLNISDDFMIYIIPFGIILLIEICVAIDMKQSVVICCVVYLSILISKSRDGGYILYTVNRVIDTSVGIIIALFVNKYIKMPDKIKRFIGLSKETETESKAEYKAEDDAINKILEENRANNSKPAEAEQAMKDN